MAINFEGNLTTLVRDLQRAGFTVQHSLTIANGAGHTAELLLSNGAVVRWDAYSQKIWAEGPFKYTRRTERFLRRRYEYGLIGRLACTRLWDLLHPLRYLAVKFRSRRSILALSSLRDLTRRRPKIRLKKLFA